MKKFSVILLSACAFMAFSCSSDKDDDNGGNGGNGGDEGNIYDSEFVITHSTLLSYYQNYESCDLYYEVSSDKKEYKKIRIWNPTTSNAGSENEIRTTQFVFSQKVNGEEFDFGSIEGYLDGKTLKYQSSSKPDEELLKLLNNVNIVGSGGIYYETFYLYYFKPLLFTSGNTFTVYDGNGYYIEFSSTGDTNRFRNVNMKLFTDTGVLYSEDKYTDASLSTTKDKFGQSAVGVYVGVWTALFSRNYADSSARVYTFEENLWFKTELDEKYAEK
ncbi:MAG: hypothetical protein LUF90_00130 [Rikenellaceae bacterium]|nr:hypothetical protein [Rikenellaceae bacterium]